jgi:hypothetical protein
MNLELMLKVYRIFSFCSRLIKFLALALAYLLMDIGNKLIFVEIETIKLNTMHTFSTLHFALGKWNMDLYVYFQRI